MTDPVFSKLNELHVLYAGEIRDALKWFDAQPLSTWALASLRGDLLALADRIAAPMVEPDMDAAKAALLAEVVGLHSVRV